MLKIKADDKLPAKLFISRNWGKTDEDASGAFDVLLDARSHSEMEGEVVVGVYALIDYVIVKNETQVVTSKTQ